MSAEDRLRVAIVGVGPKGLYCFERLVARAAESARPMRVDLFEPTGEPGTGAVYSAQQPQWLRMNFADSLIDAWPEDAATSVPPHRRESFAEWLGGDGPAAGDGYSPRAIVGRYLGDCFAAIWASLPDNVEVHLHRARVEHLERRGSGWRLRAHGAGPVAIECDEVMLAIGHRSGPAASPLELGESGVRIAYPLGDALSEETVPAGAPVYVRGMALTLIDVALALTEGRGGCFVSRDDGSARLTYVPAPGEAGTITALSRSGRPVLVKPDPARLTADPGVVAVAAEGRRRLRGRDGFDPAGDIVPELCATATALHAEVLAPADGSSRRPMPGPETLACWLEDLIIGAAVPEPATATRRLSRSWRVAEGERRPDVRWALGEAWRALYPAIVERGGHGGIEAGAWPGFAALAREMERIAFGPPPVNGAKLMALIDAGKIEFGDLGAVRDAPPAAVRVDAVLSPPGALERCDDLVDELRTAGAVRAATGGRRGIEVDRDAGCVAADGSPSRGLSAVGRLTEDWVIGNDTLSRRLHPHPDRWARRLAGR